MELINYNFDCCRDCLIFLSNNIFIESNTIKPISWLIVTQDPTLTQKYSEETIKYNLLKLQEQGFIRTNHYTYNQNTGTIANVHIQDITADGWNFLCNAKDNTIWEEAKNQAVKLKDFGMNVLANLLATLAANKIMGK